MGRRVKVYIRQPHIDGASTRDCGDCLGALGIKDVLDCAYIKVEAGKVSLLQRGSEYREASILPRQMNQALLLLDQERRDEIKPFSFCLNLVPTSKVVKATPERIARVNANRKRRAAEGRPDKKYKKTTRVGGIAVREERA